MCFFWGVNRFGSCLRWRRCVLKWIHLLIPLRRMHHLKVDPSCSCFWTLDQFWFIWRLSFTRFSSPCSLKYNTVCFLIIFVYYIYFYILYIFIFCLPNVNLKRAFDCINHICCLHMNFLPNRWPKTRVFI